MLFIGISPVKVFILTLAYLHWDNTYTCILALGYLHLHTCTWMLSLLHWDTYTCILSLANFHLDLCHCKYRSVSVQVLSIAVYVFKWFSRRTLRNAFGKNKRIYSPYTPCVNRPSPMGRDRFRCSVQAPGPLIPLSRTNANVMTIYEETLLVLHQTCENWQQ